jgi:hypothetical protein
MGSFGQFHGGLFLFLEIFKVPISNAGAHIKINDPHIKMRVPTSIFIGESLPCRAYAGLEPA